MPLFAGNLLPASFRGVPFAVERDDLGTGRRQALHVYPGRDDPWAEDMGRAPRRYRFKAFIVDNDVVFAGGPIQLQRAMLIAAVEQEGPGALVHPTLGVLQVSVTGASIGADLGAATMSSVDIEFVESGKRSFPSILSVSDLLSSSSLLTAALAIDAVRAIALASGGGGTRRDLSATAASWSARTQAAGADATSLQRLATQLPGGYGRYASGGNAGLRGSRPTIYTSASTVTDLVAVASAARTAIMVAGVALGTTIATTDLSDASDIAGAASSLVAALASACADPAEAIRLLEQLAAFAPPRPEALSPIGVAFGRAMKRAAAAQLVLACGAYQPASRDDAGALIDRIATLLDAIATEAADAGDHASYTAVRGARGAIVRDLRARGATLVQVRMFAAGAPLPAVYLAQRYYRDATRAEQLLTQLPDVAHPLFLPPSFEALAA